MFIRKKVLFLLRSISCPVMSDSLQPHGLQTTRLLCPWNSLGKNTGVGSHSFLQRIFQGSDPGLLHCRQIHYCLSHQGSPLMTKNTQNSSPLCRSGFWSSSRPQESQFGPMMLLKVLPSGCLGTQICPPWGPCSSSTYPQTPQEIAPQHGHSC